MAWLPVAAAALSAVSAIQQGRASQQAANYQATVAQQQGEQARQVAAQQEEDYRRQQSRLMGAQRAAVGGSGATMSGTPLLSSEDMAGEAELQALRIRYGGDVQTARATQEAELLRYQGKQAKKQGYMRAGASLLSSFGSTSGFGGTSPATQSPAPIIDKSIQYR